MLVEYLVFIVNLYFLMKYAQVLPGGCSWMLRELTVRIQFYEVVKAIS